MHVVGHIGGGAASGEVGVVAQNHTRPFAGHRLGIQALFFESGQRHVIKANFGQRGGVALATAWIGIHPLDQLAHRVSAIANHQRGLAACSSHQFVTHHQQTVIAARQKALDHHFVAKLGGIVEGGFYFFAGADVDRDALALIAVARFDHHGCANGLCGDPGIVGVQHGAALWHRHASGMQQLFGQVFVLCNGFGDGAARIGLRGLDAALFAAPAKLNHAAFGEAAIRDASHQCGVHDGAGGWAQSDVFVQCAQLGQGCIHVERGVVPRGLAQCLRQLQGQAAHVFFGVLDHHLIHARFGGQGGAAECHRAAGCNLHVQGGVLYGVGHAQNGALLGCAQLAQAWEKMAQALLKIGHFGQVALLALALDHGFDGGVASPQVWAAQGADA